MQNHKDLHRLAYYILYKYYDALSIHKKRVIGAPLFELKLTSQMSKSVNMINVK